MNAAMRTLKLLLGVPLWLCLADNAFAQSAYVPGKGRLDLSSSVLYFEYTDFYAGSTRDTRFDAPIKHYSASVTADYGVTESMAIDANMGYVYSTFRPQDDLDGLSDSTIGIRLQLLDESKFESGAVPSLAIRIGAIIEGTYDTFNDGTWNGLGDGASGGEISLLLGKAFGDSGVGIYGDVGYRHRIESVPEDVFGSLGVYKTFNRSLTIRVGGRVIYALSGIDLFSESFTFNDLPEAKERLFNVEAGVGYSTAQGVYYQIFAARTVWGENTGDSTFVGASVTVPFGEQPFSDELLPEPPQKGAK
jgi:hypothetical protein